MQSYMALLPLALLLILPTLAVAQNCGCPSDLCCSKYGYCGTSVDYCGTGCLAGPCTSSSFNGSSTITSLSSVVTDDFFNGIIGQADANCEGKNFYTRSAFLDAAESFDSFGTTGSTDIQKQEITAFFAHVAHKTENFCYIKEINGAAINYCLASTQWPCNHRKEYFGCGPLQITWNYNYGPAGQAIGFDGLNYPETVAKDAVISFKTALWFWTNNVNSIITSGKGFGATIRAINSIECDGDNTQSMNDRVSLYKQYCEQLGVAIGDRLTCGVVPIILGSLCF